MPHASVNGTRLYYERHGSGPPLLLITGFTISAAVFEPVLDLYTPRFECIAYDNRAAGPLGRAAAADVHARAGGGRRRPAACARTSTARTSTGSRWAA